MTPLFTRLAALALLAFAIACGSSNHERGEPCDSSDNCASGLTCASGECRAPCNLDSECPFGTGCTGGLCMPLAAGACAQASDCRTPLDACHLAFGARCTSGRCEYNRASTPACAEQCESNADCDEPGPCSSPGTGRCIDTGCVYSTASNGTACMHDTVGVCFDGRCVDCLSNADCDPRDFGRDLCFTGVCTDRTCGFTEIVPCDRDPLGSDCAEDDDCRSGYCSNDVCCASRCDGLCMACSAEGQCDEMPRDDERCGVIDCDGLDDTCRNYHDYTDDRCADIGRCIEPNSDECESYSNASNSTVCRSVVSECDVVERCSQGVCPADVVALAGLVCNGGPPSVNSGRCDGVSSLCRKLSAVSYGARWFMEESYYAANRQDAFGALPLVYSGTSSVTRAELTTGAGVRWPDAASTAVYCSDLDDLPLASELTVLTFEAVVSVNDDDFAEDSTVLMLGPTANRAKLSLRRNNTEPPGQVTVKGTFGDTAAYYTWKTTLSSRAVLHLTIDGAQATANTAMRLHVNGTEVPPLSTSTAASMIDVQGTDTLCIGNDMVPDIGAFVGVIWYGAVYLEVLGDDAIRDAALRLAQADKP